MIKQIILNLNSKTEFKVYSESTIIKNYRINFGKSEIELYTANSRSIRFDSKYIKSIHIENEILYIFTNTMKRFNKLCEKIKWKGFE